VGRAAATSVCRCPVMSARRSLAGCPADVRGASACSCSPGSALPWIASRLWGVGDRAACVPSGGTTSRRRAPSQAHGRDRDAPRRREPDGGRAGACATAAGCHLDLCEGRPARARSGCSAMARERGMSTLAEHVQNYLRLRRALGSSSSARACCSPSSSRAPSERGSARSRRVRAPVGQAPGERQPELSLAAAAAVRSFARYLHALDPACEIPPLELLPASKHRPAPYLYRDEEIVALMGRWRASPRRCVRRRSGR